MDAVSDAMADPAETALRRGRHAWLAAPALSREARIEGGGTPARLLAQAPPGGVVHLAARAVRCGRAR